MQVIVLKDNLSDHFDLITYPDGQHSIKLKLDMINVKKPIIIKCRIKTFAEFEVLFCLLAALDKNDFMVEIVDFKYLIGMRSDRAFSIAEPNYFNIIKSLINKIRCEKLILAPHSASNLYLLYKTYESQISLEDDCVIDIGGDESYKYCRFNFIKKRTTDGIEVYLPQDDLNKIRLYLQTPESDVSLNIVDDLCDGGATFIAEANYLKQYFGGLIKKLTLSVTHGLFSKGIDHVSDHFDHIYCTNSYQEINHPKVTVTDVFKE